MAADLNVNEHHHAQIYNYIRFSRYQRGQRMRAVDFCFDEIKTQRYAKLHIGSGIVPIALELAQVGFADIVCKDETAQKKLACLAFKLLNDTTFTIDEVTDLLDSLLQSVQGEVEAELINAAHTNVLLLRQMFIQAEKWHLKLSADISELENREILDQIAEFEEKQFAGTKRDTDFQSMLKHVKLGPMNESGGTALLYRKIEELEKENEQFREKLTKLQSGAGLSSKERQQLEADLARTQAQLRNTSMSGESDELKRKMALLQAELDKDKGKAGSNPEMEKDLTETKHELLRVRDMLEMAEKELEKKVSQTAPFKNLKQMLMKKNETLKDLRKRLTKYESVDED